MRNVPGLNNDFCARRYSSAVAKRVQRIVAESTFPHVFREAVNGVVESSGKMVRPILVLASAEILGARFTKSAMEAAVAIEMIHISSLILDDIMDQSPLRRGNPTLHAKYGIDVAILTSGVLLLKGLRNVADARRMRDLGYDAMYKLTLGQAIEMRGEINLQKHYIRMVRLKTGALFEAATLFGATAGGVTPAATRNLALYGQYFGIAFQLADDVLDFIGNPKDLGKPTGNDLTRGSPSILLVDLRRRLGMSWNELRSQDASWIRQQITSNGIVEESKTIVSEYCLKALNSLKGFPRTSAKSLLERLVEDLLAKVGLSQERLSF